MVKEVLKIFFPIGIVCFLVSDKFTPVPGAQQDGLMRVGTLDEFHSTEDVTHTMAVSELPGRLCSVCPHSVL